MAQNSTLPEYEKYVNSIVKSFAQEIKQELDLDCTGDGGRMPNDVEKISVNFSAQRRATIEEARQLQVYASERLLRAINAHEKLRPFLREYPFTPARVGICISFQNDYNSDQYADGTICLTSGIKGNIYYQTSDPFTYEFTDILIEPYEEAAKIVCATPLKAEEIRLHRDNAYEKYVDQFFISFFKEVHKKWGLYCLGFGGKMADGIDEMAIRFVIDKRTPLEKARELHVAVTEKLHEKINADPILRPHLKEYPFPISRTKVYISFQKRDHTYWEDGTVAIVRQENEKIFYFTELPMVNGRQPVRPVPLAEESYEEAKKIINKSSKK